MRLELINEEVAALWLLSSYKDGEEERIIRAKLKKFYRPWCIGEETLDVKATLDRLVEKKLAIRTGKNWIKITELGLTGLELAHNVQFEKGNHHAELTDFGCKPL